MTFAGEPPMPPHRMRQVVIDRLRDLTAYLEVTAEPDWGHVGVELDALARTLYRLRGGESPA